MKERESLHQNTDKGDVNILMLPRLPLVISHQKHKSKHVHARNYNFENDWLIEMFDNKLCYMASSASGQDKPNYTM